MPSARETMQLRQARAMTLDSGTAMTTFRDDRRCEATDCRTLLSRYNPASTCSTHAGWQDPPGKRQRV
jgi:hypothetical protein